MRAVGGMENSQQTTKRKARRQRRQSTDNEHGASTCERNQRGWACIVAMLSPGQLRLTSLHGAGMHVLWLNVGLRAQFDADDPRVLQDILDEDPVFWAWLSNPSEDRSARARREVLDRRGIQCRVLLLLLLRLHGL